MKRDGPGGRSIAGIWELARSGDLRGGAEAARDVLGGLQPDGSVGRRVELHLVVAFCSMRQGHHAEALHELDAADQAASSPRVEPGLALRVATWRAELAYFQGRYSEVDDIVTRLVEPLERRGDWAYAAFALRIRIAVLLARTDYEGATGAGRSRHRGRGSERGRLRDGADPQRARRGRVRPRDVEARRAARARPSVRARSARHRAHGSRRARSAGLTSSVPAPWPSARTTSLRRGTWPATSSASRSCWATPPRAVRMIRKRLGILQARGATYDEIVTRSNLAWGLADPGQAPGGAARARRRARPGPRHRHVQRAARIPRIRPLDRPRRARRHERRARELSALSAARERMESERPGRAGRCRGTRRGEASARTFLPEARRPLRRGASR